MVGPGGATEYRGVPQSPQKPCNRFDPLFGDFHIGLGLTAREVERLKLCRRVYPECRARQCLTVRAVTKHDMGCIDLGSELDVAAVASFCDFHSSASYKYVTTLDAQRSRAGAGKRAEYAQASSAPVFCIWRLGRDFMSAHCGSTLNAMPKSPRR